MPADADVLRRDIVAVCQRLYQRGFIAGTEGNVSALEGPGRLWITPSGHHKGLLQPADLLLIDTADRERRLILLNRLVDALDLHVDAVRQRELDGVRIPQVKDDAVFL